MSDVCVAHLVREQNGVEPFRRFIASYKKNTGGIGHDLLIIWKGFADTSATKQYRAMIGDVPHRSVFVADVGFDIQPYLDVADRFCYKYFCFLNSFSIILDPNWLAKLYEHAKRPDVGLVGCTGSGGSLHSFALYMDGKPSYYSSILSDETSVPPSGARRELITAFRNKSFSQRFLIDFDPKVFARGLQVATRFFHLRNDERERKDSVAHFQPFPAYHVRTNAFIAPRDVLLKTERWRIAKKFDAYKFESGNRSLTNQVLGMGLNTLIVGADGQAYLREQWADSETFWQGKQSNLLVADKQTLEYTFGDADKKLFLSKFAWGEKSNPILHE